MTQAAEIELAREREASAALQKELLQLRLLVEEAESSRHDAEARARDMASKAARDAAAAADAQAQVRGSDGVGPAQGQHSTGMV